MNHTYSSVGLHLKIWDWGTGENNFFPDWFIRDKWFKGFNDHLWASMWFLVIYVNQWGIYNISTAIPWLIYLFSYKDKANQWHKTFVHIWLSEIITGNYVLLVIGYIYEGVRYTVKLNQIWLNLKCLNQSFLGILAFVN